MEDRALLAETADGREAPPLRPPTRTMAFAVVALCLVAVGVVATRDPALGAVAAGGLALVDVADDAAVSGSAMTATPAALGSVSKGHPSVEEVYISVNASAAVSSIMPLSVRVTVTDPTAAPAKVDAMKISLAYKPVSGSSLDALFTEFVVLNSTNGFTASIDIHRLRPGVEYRVHAYQGAHGMCTKMDGASTTFRAPTTGIPRFDERALATVEGETPSWEMLTFAYSLSVADADGRADDGDNSFDGLVAVDAEGWVVWYYPVADLVDWDFMPTSAGGGVVLLADGVGNKALSLGSERSWTGPDGESTYSGNSRLTEVSPKGELRNQYTQGCTGGPKSYNALANTVRVDDTSPDISVITTAYEIASYPNVTLISHHGVGGDAVIEQLHADSFAGSRVVRWHRGETGSESYSGSDGALETAYNLFAFANPLSHAGRPESSSWSTLDGVGCSGGETSSSAIIDYHHVTSVHPGPDANFIVASKNLNAVWSIRADGTAAQWRLSSSMDTSDDTGVMHLAFEREADKFYEPRTATQMADGRLLVFDGGASRPGCRGGGGTEPARAGCFSRAVVYRLDFSKKIAKLDWQFELSSSLNSGSHDAVEWNNAMTHDLFVPEGGSATRLSSGHILVGYTAPYAGTDSGERTFDADQSMSGWEVDLHARTRSRVVIPKSLDTSVGGERLVPWASIGGESTKGPELGYEMTDGFNGTDSSWSMTYCVDGGQAAASRR